MLSHLTFFLGLVIFTVLLFAAFVMLFLLEFTLPRFVLNPLFGFEIGLIFLVIAEETSFMHSGLISTNSSDFTGILSWSLATLLEELFPLLRFDLDDLFDRAARSWLELSLLRLVLFLCSLALASFSLVFWISFAVSKEFFLLLYCVDFNSVYFINRRLYWILFFSVVKELLQAFHNTTKLFVLQNLKIMSKDLNINLSYLKQAKCYSKTMITYALFISFKFSLYKQLILFDRIILS